MEYSWKNILWNHSWAVWLKQPFLDHALLLFALLTAVALTFTRTRKFQKLAQLLTHGRALWIALALIAILARAWTFLSLRTHEATPYNPIFLETLRQDFFGYWMANTIKPPFEFFWAKLLSFFSDAALTRHYLAVIWTFTANAIATLVLFDLLRKITRNEPLGFLISAGFTIASTPFETLQNGWSIDQPNFLLTVLFTRSLISTPLMMGLAGALLCTQSTVGSLVVPVSVLFALIGQRRVSVRSVFIACGLPIALVLLICGRNFAIGGFFAPSNLGGVGRAQNIWHWMAKPESFYREESKKLGLPEWFQWCMDRTQAPLGSDGQPMMGWNQYALGGGYCFPIDARVAPRCGPYDMTPLYDYLKTNHADEMATEVVRRDLQDGCDHPERFSGWQPYMQPRWVGYYGAQYQKLASHLIAQNKLSYLEYGLSKYRNFVLLGPTYFRTERKSPGLTKEKSYLPFYSLYEALLRIGLFALPLLLILSKTRRKLLPFGVAFAVTASIYCSGAAFEHDRYFLQVMPYVLVFASVALADWLGFVSQKWKR